MHSHHILKKLLRQKGEIHEIIHCYHNMGTKKQKTAVPIIYNHLYRDGTTCLFSVLSVSQINAFK